jgi:hypothetical protein
MPEPGGSESILLMFFQRERYFFELRSCLLTETYRRRQDRPDDSRRAEARKHLEEDITRQTEAVGRYGADWIERLEERALGSIRRGIGRLAGADAEISGLLVGQDACDSEFVGVV